VIAAAVPFLVGALPRIEDHGGHAVVQQTAAELIVEPTGA